MALSASVCLSGSETLTKSNKKNSSKIRAQEMKFLRNIKEYTVVDQMKSEYLQEEAPMQ